MTNGVLLIDRERETAYWQQQYPLNLFRQINLAIAFIQENGIDSTKIHSRSFFTLLDHARNYPQLDENYCRLFDLLHPYPIQWGFGYEWERFIDLALTIRASKHKQDRLLADLAEIQYNTGSFSKAIQTCDKLIALSGTATGQLSRAISLKIDIYRLMAHPEISNELFTKWSADFYLDKPASQVPPHLIEGWLRLKRYSLQSLREQGKLKTALNVAHELVDADQKYYGKEYRLTADLYTRRGILFWVNALYPQAIQDYDYAIKLYEQNKDPFNSWVQKSDLGLIYWAMGEFDKAETLLKSTIQYYKEIRAQQLITYDLGNLGLVYFARGELDLAFDYTRQQIDHAWKINLLSEYYRGRSNLADMYYYLGEYEKSIEEHRLTDEYYENHGSREGYGMGLVWVACCKFQLGRQQEALDSLYEILDYCESNDSKVLLSLVHRCLAQFLPRNMRKQHLSASYAIACQQGRQLEIAACLISMAQLEEEESEKQRVWNEGVKILNQMGAQKWLEGHSIEDPPFIAMFV